MEVLKEKGIDHLEVFKRVQERVYRASSGQQRPYFEDGVIGPCYLNPGAASAVPAASPAASAEPEVAFWSSITSSSDPRDFEAYLARYPEGTFAPLARNRLEALRSNALAATGPALPAWAEQVSRGARGAVLRIEGRSAQSARSAVAFVIDKDGWALTTDRAVEGLSDPAPAPRATGRELPVRGPEALTASARQACHQ